MGITLDSIKQKMLGKTFGSLLIVEYAGRSTRGDNLWRCECSCGEQFIARTAMVDKDTSACQFCKIKRGKRSTENRTQLLNKRFGRLTVTSYRGKDKNNAGTWWCKCDCGNLRIVRTNNLTSGRTTSCGCYQRDLIKDAHTTHGLSDHSLYSLWYAMKDRCYNTNNKRYDDYGGRGIRVCDLWLDDFTQFYRWGMDNGYQSGLSIERKDNNGDYEPDNCRWATQQEQQQNTRKNKVSSEDIQSIRDDTRTNLAISKDYGVNESTISRIKTGFTWGNI